jgi:drug/metabolite transporter (DMT)-like permease
MKKFIQELFKDKSGNYSMREIAIALLLLALLTSWIAMQFFGKDIPEFMFFSFSSLIAAGCFGYSLEKRGSPPNNELP